MYFRAKLMPCFLELEGWPVGGSSPTACPPWDSRCGILCCSQSTQSTLLVPRSMPGSCVVLAHVAQPAWSCQERGPAQAPVRTREVPVAAPRTHCGCSTSTCPGTELRRLIGLGGTWCLKPLMEMLIQEAMALGGLYDCNYS